MHGPPLEVVVWGDFACFTRPEMKVERVSYAVMTPSAARGILEAIFWHPEVSWLVREIQVLKPIRWFSIKRNEISGLMNAEAAQKWAKKGEGNFFADDSEGKNRAQRATLCLRDVAYRIKADVFLRSHATADIAKYRAQFHRRVQNGKCFHRPVLGCREFAAEFAPDTTGIPNLPSTPFVEDVLLGRMLFDIDFDQRAQTNRLSDEEVAGIRLCDDLELISQTRSVDNRCSGHGAPFFFDAKLKSGLLVEREGKSYDELYQHLRWAREVKR